MSVGYDLVAVTGLLENTGASLVREPTERPIVLRLLQRRVSDLASVSKDEYVIFLGRFMENYVRKLWGNLAVDFTYESGSTGKKILSNLLVEVGQTLISMAGSLRQRKIEDFQKSLNTLTIAYDKAVREINEKKELIQNELLKEVRYGRILHPEEIDEGRKELFEILQESKAITKSQYNLAGGAPSEYFFDIDKFISEPRFGETISDYYAKIIRETTEKDPLDMLAFVEKDIGTIGLLPHMSLILAKTKLNGFVVRISKDVSIGKIKCSPDFYPKPGNRIGIVSDVITAAEGVMRASRAIGDLGAETPYAFVLYNRSQVSSHTLEENGIRVRAIMERSDLIRIGFIEDKPEMNFDSDEAKVIPTASWKIDEFRKGLSDKTCELSQQMTV
jgi:orotate phosphoribosyltransferase